MTSLELLVAGGLLIFGIVIVLLALAAAIRWLANPYN